MITQCIETGVLVEQIVSHGLYTNNTHLLDLNKDRYFTVKSLYVYDGDIDFSGFDILSYGETIILGSIYDITYSNKDKT